jgi:oligopeptide transport system substrate-binding protein
VIGFWAIALCFLAALVACHPPQSSDRTVLRRGQAGEPSTLDPGLAADIYSTTLVTDLYEGLTSESPSGEVVPGVAKSWTVDPAGTEYTFTLRSDARWSNGEAVRAQDFVASWRREVDPKFGAPGADDLRLVAHAVGILAGRESPTALGISAPSDMVLVVKLDRPAPYFPEILAHPSTYPIYMKGTGRIGSHDSAHWVSNGPYVLSAWLPTTRIDLKRNEAYWDRSRVRIGRVRYEFMPSDASQYAAYRAGELDMTDIVPVNALSVLRQQSPTELLITPFLGTAYYGINLSNKTLSSVALRQALAMAIDRRRLVDSLGFGQVPAYGFVPPGTANYAPQEWDWKSLADADRVRVARRLYKEAGFSTTTPLRLRVLFNSNEVIQRTAVQASRAISHRDLS